MSQSRRMSLVEAIANVTVGFVIAVLTQMAVFPLLRIRISLHQHLLVTLAFTLVSLVRSYVLRRLFVRFGGV